MRNFTNGLEQIQCHQLLHQSRRGKAGKVVGWAAVDTGIAVLSIGLGVITSVKSLSTVHAVVFVMVGVVSFLGLWVAGKVGGYVNQKWPQYDGFIWPHPRLALAM